MKDPTTNSESTSDEVILRDHNERCRHGYQRGHEYWVETEFLAWCDGGKAYEVLDRVTAVIEGWAHAPHGHALVVEETSDSYE